MSIESCICGLEEDCRRTLIDLGNAVLRMIEGGSMYTRYRELLQTRPTSNEYSASSGMAKTVLLVIHVWLCSVKVWSPSYNPKWINIVRVLLYHFKIKIVLDTVWTNQLSCSIITAMTDYLVELFVLLSPDPNMIANV